MTATTPATDALVSTQWVADHLSDPNIRLVESDEDILLYEMGHIPGAVKIDWTADLQDATVRDFINQDQFARLLSRSGIANDTTVVFYGDKNNWWAAYEMGSRRARVHPRRPELPRDDLPTWRVSSGTARAPR
jgi:3-mercaptopyruvate sulfurtransferase SseA